MKTCGTKNCRSKIIKRGHFFRKGRSAPIQRYHCKACKKNFSAATKQRAYRQHKRHVNSDLFKLLCSSVSMRRSAMILGTTKKTVARKLKWLAHWARVDQQRYLAKLKDFSEIQFDEMESFEHTKCKPLSVPLAVTKKERIILAWSVCSMPAKGHLAKISLKKYGKRADDRKAHLIKVLTGIKPFVSEHTVLTSDMCPRYPPLVEEHFPHQTYKTFKGRRGAVVGQGELKKVGRDPLFYLNHTAAMLRANISRLVRKTWNTTKKPEGLIDHISLYVYFHNTRLLKHA